MLIGMVIGEDAVSVLFWFLSMEAVLTVFKDLSIGVGALVGVSVSLLYLYQSSLLYVWLVV